MDFVAIDFETANRKPNSACEIGIVVVENGRTVDTYRHLIKPTPNKFESGNIRVHGIRPEQVMFEPTFAELYDDLIPYLADRHVVAHNASFDIGVLLASLNQYGLPKPSLTYSCTVQLARKTWPEAPRYGLGILSEFLDIELDHHQALSDANACAQIMIQAHEVFGVEHVDDLLAEVGQRARSINEYGNSVRKKSKKFWKGRSVKGKDLEVRAAKPKTSIHNWPDHPELANLNPKIKPSGTPASKPDGAADLRGKRFVFTGELSQCSRETAQSMVLDAGGRCTKTITGATNYLVQGTSSKERPSSKLRKAEQQREAGKDIHIVDEDTFFILLGK